MPDYQFNTNLGPAQQQGTSLGDLINTARGVQAYQQAEQSNPLALQKAQMEIEQAKQLNPLAVQKATAETGTAQLGLNKAHAQLSHEMFGGLRNDPDILNAEKNPQAAIRKIMKFESLIENAGVPKTKIAPVSSYLMDEAIKNPKALASHLDTLIQAGIGATGQQALQTPQLGTVGNAPATFTPGTGVAKPLTIGAQNGSFNLGNQPAGGGVPNVATPTGVTPTQMSLQYPVRRAGDIRPYAPNEEKDQASGFSYRDKLAETATNVSTSLRNIDEVIKEAEKIGKEEWMKGSGVIGSLGRNVSTILGTEQGDRYKRLSKDLANLQLSLGADKTTDAGKNLVAAANGDITLPPDVLLDIAHRSKADRENLTMQAAGAQAFAKKFGDSNMKTFQNLWGENSKDTRLFEAIAINNSNMSKEEKKDRIDELFKGLSAKQIDKLTQQKNNLIKLSRTGEL